LSCTFILSVATTPKDAGLIVQNSAVNRQYEDSPWPRELQDLGLVKYSVRIFKKYIEKVSLFFKNKNSGLAA